jgi:hypothetical protein
MLVSQASRVFTPPVSRDSLAHARSLAVTPLLCPSVPPTQQHPPLGPRNRPPPMLELLPRSSMTNPAPTPIPNRQPPIPSPQSPTLSTEDPANSEKEAAALLELHKHKGVPCHPAELFAAELFSQDGFVFSKAQRMQRTPFCASSTKDRVAAHAPSPIPKPRPFVHNGEYEVVCAPPGAWI